MTIYVTVFCIQSSFWSAAQGTIAQPGLRIEDGPGAGFPACIWGHYFINSLRNTNNHAYHLLQKLSWIQTEVTFGFPRLDSELLPAPCPWPRCFYHHCNIDRQSAGIYDIWFSINMLHYGILLHHSDAQPNGKSGIAYYLAYVDDIPPYICPELRPP